MHTFSELVQQFEQWLRSSRIFPQSPPALYEPCSYLVGLGGKRIRPALCLMSAELFGPLPEDAWKAAAAIELFHTFTLAHDDIMDKAPLRRGQPTIHERNGLTAGILCGDVLSMLAYDQLSQMTGAYLPAVLRLFNKTAIEVCEGQQMDMDFETAGQVTVDEYIRMITLKTSVLLAASLKIGALIGGATVGNADKLYAFGKNLGIAFQLQDDYLDAFGDSVATGKQPGGDIRANKKTYLHLKAMEAASVPQHTFLKQQATNAEEKVAQSLQLFRETGADTACREAVLFYSNRAFECLEETAVVRKRKEPLHMLAAELLQRQS